MMQADTPTDIHPAKEAKMESQIVALPQPQSAWTYDADTRTAIPVTLIAFRDDDSCISYLAQIAHQGNVTTKWIQYVCTEGVAQWHAVNNARAAA